MKVWAGRRRQLRNHRLIRLDFPRGSTGNLLNQLLGIGGLTEGQSYGNPTQPRNACFTSLTEPTEMLCLDVDLTWIDYKF